MIAPEWSSFRGRVRLCACVKCALFKINGFTAIITFMGFVKFVGKDFLWGIAVWTLSCKGFEILKLFKTRAVFGGCCHGKTEPCSLSQGFGCEKWIKNSG